MDQVAMMIKRARTNRTGAVVCARAIVVTDLTILSLSVLPFLVLTVLIIVVLLLTGGSGGG